MEEGSPKERRATDQGKTFNWCPHHKAWCVHKPRECHLGMPVTNMAASTGNRGQADNANTVLATALVVLHMEKS